MRKMRKKERYLRNQADIEAKVLVLKRSCIRVRLKFHPVADWPSCHSRIEYRKMKLCVFVLL